MARLLFLILASTSVLASSSEAAAEAAGRRGGSGGRRNEKLRESTNDLITSLLINIHRVICCLFPLVLAVTVFQIIRYSTRKQLIACVWTKGSRTFLGPTMEHVSSKVSIFLPANRFQNSICPGANGVNGTCYTQEECSDRGGTNGGSCASGFGVCCQSMNTCHQIKYRSIAGHRPLEFWGPGGVYYIKFVCYYNGIRRLRGGGEGGGVGS